MVHSSLFSSSTDDWATPQDFFRKCAAEVGGAFDLDPAASSDNAKAPVFFTKETDGLSQEWHGKVWLNPPYGRQISKWISKAVFSVEKGNADLCYLLIPSRTDTAYFHDFLYQKPNVELRFVRGRLKFGWSENSAPFPSLLAVIKKPV